MTARRAAALACLTAALAGCQDEREPDPHPTGERVIRGWLKALNRADYERAAGYFAVGAIIDQGDPFRLPSPAAARIFNAGLPCRADLTALKPERETVLATFRLRAGPGGPCSGLVRVRYTIRRGRITEWRQRPQLAPPGDETI